MNNEPVAWMSKEDFENKDKEIWTLYKVRYEKKYDYTVPLYTHPADLTDEEIGEVMKQCDWQYDPESFAKAILRKAQEK